MTLTSQYQIATQYMTTTVGSSKQESYNADPHARQTCVAEATFHFW